MDAQKAVAAIGNSIVRVFDRRFLHCRVDPVGWFRRITNVGRMDGCTD
jgi:hypothetical protein